MSRKLFVNAIPFALIFLLLAGCGSSNTATPTPTQAPVSIKIDACALLTKADAEQIMGGPVDDPIHPVKGGARFVVDSCKYTLTGGLARENVTLSVTIPANGDLAAAREAYNTGKQKALEVYSAPPVDVPGLGEAAYWVGGDASTLVILKGNANITLSAFTQVGDSVSQAMLDLGKVVLGRLP